MPYAIDKQNPVDGDFRCYEQLVLCQRTESDTHQLNIIIHDLPNAKCCNYNGKVIPFGETIIDAEVNLKLLDVHIYIYIAYLQ